MRFEICPSLSASNCHQPTCNGWQRLVAFTVDTGQCAHRSADSTSQNCNHVKRRRSKGARGCSCYAAVHSMPWRSSWSLQQGRTTRLQRQQGPRTPAASWRCRSAPYFHSATSENIHISMTITIKKLSVFFQHSSYLAATIP